MPNLNKVSLIGHMTADPEIRAMSNGKNVANFSVAVSERWKDKTTGEKKEHTEFVRCTDYSGADYLAKYAKKGILTIVEGKLRTRKYEKDGITKYVTEVIVDNAQVYSGLRSATAEAAAPATLDDEIAF